MIGIILSFMIAAMAAQSSGSAPSRWDSGTAQPAAPQVSQPQAQPQPAPAPRPAPAPQMVTPKSDLPGSEPVALPPGAVRLEDVKPGTRPAAPAEPVDSTLYDTRSQPVQQPYPAAAPAPTAQARPYAAPPSGGCKTDLPGGACDDAALPPGAKRIEEIKPGAKQKPVAGEAAPAYPPPPSQPAVQYGGHKSDLPGAEPVVVPPGAVRLEDVKPGTRPKQAGASTPAPTPPSTEEFAPPPKPSGTIQETPVGAESQPAVQTKTKQRWQ